MKSNNLYLNPNVAKAGAIQRQGAKGAAVVIDCNPMATPDLDGSGFPARGHKMSKKTFSQEITCGGLLKD